MTNEKDSRIYVLAMGNVGVQPGQRVRLKGKKGKKVAGTRAFDVRKLVKDDGSCKKQSALPITRLTIARTKPSTSVPAVSGQHVLQD